MASPLSAKLWASTIPLSIYHPSSPLPYLISIPRLSYLPLLLPRLSLFFGIRITTFSYQGIVLRNLPVGLLWDLYCPAGEGEGDESPIAAEGEKENDGEVTEVDKEKGDGGLPWKIEAGEGLEYDILDTFVNSVKEADFIRNGTARGVMSMSKENSTSMWNAVVDNDYQTYLRITTPLLNPPTPLRHIPLRIYIPTSSTSSPSPNPSEPATTQATTPAFTYRCIQSLLPPFLSTSSNKKEIQTLGTALNSTLPSLFPSRRDPILANAILHGAPVPFRAPLEEVMREGAYMDGWVSVVVRMV